MHKGWFHLCLVRKESESVKQILFYPSKDRNRKPSKTCVKIGFTFVLLERIRISKQILSYPNKDRNRKPSKTHVKIGLHLCLVRKESESAKQILFYPNKDRNRTPSQTCVKIGFIFVWLEKNLRSRFFPTQTKIETESLAIHA